MANAAQRFVQVAWAQFARRQELKRPTLKPLSLETFVQVSFSEEWLEQSLYQDRATVFKADFHRTEVRWVVRHIYLHMFDQVDTHVCRRDFHRNEFLYLHMYYLRPNTQGEPQKMHFPKWTNRYGIVCSVRDFQRYAACLVRAWSP